MLFLFVSLNWWDVPHYISSICSHIFTTTPFCRALKYVSYFIKQTGREQESNDTKMEKIKSILDKSLLYFRKYKLFFKTFYNTKKKEKKNGV